MCLISFSWKHHPKYDLVVAANRDEFYNRPTRQAQFWEDYPTLLAGKDLKDGGTWLGITKCHRFAALTNYRDFARIKEQAPSRGHLVTDFLKGSSSPEEYITQLRESTEEYNLFNLLLSDGKSLWYFNNVNFEYKELDSGTYSLSNGLLDEEWPKVIKGKKQLENVFKNETLNANQIFEGLTDNEKAPQDKLPQTGVPLGMEIGLSSMFIELPGYGTRCSTVILSNKEQTIFSEKTYEKGQSKETHTFEF